MKIKTGDYSGSSDLGINEAIQNALQEVPEPTKIKIVETRSSWIAEEKRYYQVIVSTFEN